MRAYKHVARIDRARVVYSHYSWLLGNRTVTAVEQSCEIMNAPILKALRSKTKSLTLDNSNIQSLPATIGQLTFLESLSLQNNFLQSLPVEIVHLTAVSQIANCSCRTPVASYFLSQDLSAVNFSQSWRKSAFNCASVLSSID